MYNISELKLKKFKKLNSQQLRPIFSHPHTDLYFGKSIPGFWDAETCDYYTYSIVYIIKN